MNIPDIRTSHSWENHSAWKRSEQNHYRQLVVRGYLPFERIYTELEGYESLPGERRVTPEQKAIVRKILVEGCEQVRNLFRDGGYATSKGIFPREFPEWFEGKIADDYPGPVEKIDLRRVKKDLGEYKVPADSAVQFLIVREGAGSSIFFGVINDVPGARGFPYLEIEGKTPTVIEGGILESSFHGYEGEGIPVLVPPSLAARTMLIELSLASPLDVREIELPRPQLRLNRYNGLSRQQKRGILERFLQKTGS